MNIVLAIVCHWKVFCLIFNENSIFGTFLCSQSYSYIIPEFWHKYKYEFPVENQSFFGYPVPTYFYNEIMILELSIPTPYNFVSERYDYKLVSIIYVSFIESWMIDQFMSII